MRRPKRWFPIAVVVVALLVPALIVLRVGGYTSGQSVRRVTGADPTLQAAARRAQSELNIFLAELAQPRAGERFAIKGAFKSDAGTEYIWVRDPKYKAGVFQGILDQVPIAVRTLHKGDTVSVARADVFDWMIKDGDKTRGGYTERALAP